VCVYAPRFFSGALSEIAVYVRSQIVRAVQQVLQGVYFDYFARVFAFQVVRVVFRVRNPFKHSVVALSLETTFPTHLFVLPLFFWNLSFD